MPRLTHRILASRPHDFVWACPPDEARTAFQFMLLHHSALASQRIPVIIADNVAELVDEARLAGRLPFPYRDYPSCPASFDGCFVEWNVSGQSDWVQAGAFVTATTLRLALEVIPYTRERFADAMKQHPTSYSLLALYHIGTHRSGRVSVTEASEILSDKDGKPLYGESINFTDLSNQSCRYDKTIVLFALACMNHPDVEKLDLTHAEGPTKQWLRDHRLPRIRYNGLRIPPSVRDLFFGSR